MSECKNEENEKKSLEKMIAEMLENLRKDTCQNINNDIFWNCSKIIQNISQIGDSESESLFIYHNKTIQGFIEECSQIIKKVSKDQLIDLFIKQTETIYCLIYMMNTIFTYLDSHYAIANNKGSLCKNAFGLYKFGYFNIIQNDIFLEVNKLIKEERKFNNKLFWEKIKKILKILKDLDLEEPKIIKENNKISFVSESDSNQKDTPFQDIFFMKYFFKETIQFAKDKGNIDIKNMSIYEYCISEIKYLDEENKRQKEFINPKYHLKINKINHKYLIGDHAEELAKKENSIDYMFINKRKDELSQIFQFLNYTQNLH